MIQGSMQAGGAEKAMVSLLNTMSPDRYEVDLMLGHRSGLFYDQIPNWVNVIDEPFPFSCFSHKPVDWTFYFKHPLYWLKKVKRTLVAKKQNKLHIIQSLWQQWRKDIPVFDKSYDVAYGGQEGLANYFVIDKVKAERKIVWIHSNYDKLGYNISFDRPYFKVATIVATMSPEAREVLKKDFPESADHVWFLENITNGEMIWDMAKKKISDPDFVQIDDGLNIISVGRLCKPKNFARALHTGVILKNNGVKFHWTIIGEGPLRGQLEELRDKLGLAKDFSMIGLRSNPYQYIVKSDMMVVTSDYEGRSIAIDEAQILDTPVITTNYGTAVDAVSDGETGLICAMEPEKIADSIVRLGIDKDLYGHIKEVLKAKSKGNIAVIKDYYKAFDGD